MNLNKYRSKRMKFTYDSDSQSQRIIREGVRELYAFVYKRLYDLTKYDSEVLEKYELKRAKYVYLGSSNEINLRRRCSVWKADIKRNKNVSKDIIKFIKNLKRFYELETDYTVEEIDYLLYYNASIIARCENLQSARKLEEYFTTEYHQLDFYDEILEQHIILLSKKDSVLKDIKDDSIKLLQVKKNRF